MNKIELIKVSTGLTGKMEGMTVITTAMTNNEHCQRLRTCDGSICQHCFSHNALSYRPNVRNCYERNGEILKSRIIPKEQLPFINAQYCRFESHGDLHNVTHLENYVNIAKKNPHCQFALWSKQYGILKEFFKDHKQPKNLNIIVSSILLNNVVDLKQFTDIGMRVKSFTVYDKEAAKDVEINCGNKKCKDCLTCYRKNGKVTEIRELIK